MLIYQLVFGVDSGQVLCVFHDDTRPSAGIGPNGEYNCFKCGVKAHDELGFICKYFGVGAKRAARIKTALNNLQNYKYSMLSITSEQRNFLRSIGIIDSVIDKYFFSSAVGKLMYKHIWNGFPVGYTWFNNPSLSNYNASADKYHYDKNNIAGFLTPYDDVIRYKWLVICEGEKDMLTAKSFNISNAVAKLGGAKSYIIGGVPLRNKSIVLCYDCDEAGREGAIQDATILTEQFGCRVKIVDLNLQDKEDLNDYFMKYNKTYHDFYNLIKATPIFVPQPKINLTKVQKFVDSLNADELIELEQILKIRKGEN
jgi:DNA primase